LTRCSKHVKEAGLTQAQVAERMGTQAPAVARRGARISYGSTLAIHRYLAEIYQSLWKELDPANCVTSQPEHG